MSVKYLRRLKCFCRESDNLSKLLVLLLRQVGRCGGGAGVAGSGSRMGERMEGGGGVNRESNEGMGDVMDDKIGAQNKENIEKEEDLMFKYIDENSSGDEHDKKNNNNNGENRNKNILNNKNKRNNKNNKNNKPEESDLDTNPSEVINKVQNTPLINTETENDWYSPLTNETESESDEEESGNIGDILIPIKDQKMTELRAKIEDAIFLKGCIEERGLVLWERMAEGGVGEGWIERFFDLNSSLFFIPIMVLCVEEGYRGGCRC